MSSKGRYGKYVSGLIIIGDYICINIVFLIVYVLFKFDSNIFNNFIWGIFNISYIPVCSLFSSIHNRRVVYANHIVITALESTIGHSLAMIAMLYLFDNKAPEFINKYILILFVFEFMVMALWWILARKMLKVIRKKGYNFRRVIIVGYGRTGKLLEKALLSDAGYGYKIMGVFDDNESLQKSHKLYNGNIGAVEKFALKYNIDEIYCALPTTEEEKIMSLTRFSEKNAIHFYIIPSTTSYLHRRIHFDNIGDVPVMSIRREPLENPINKFIKRAFDIVFSGTFLLFSPIIFIPVAIAVKLSSPGPVFFKQKRTGIKGQEFDCYKFRTMRVNVDSDNQQATKDDPRKTKVGDFLRRTSIDELPQFWNVLKGDMSVIGPRPHMIKHTEDYSKLIESYMLRHLVKPGISGWAQVNGYRGETKELWQMEKRVEYDVWYIENWDFFLDLKIIYLTVINAFKGEKNAY